MKPSPGNLCTCVAGIYVSFLVWALCQERLSTTPYPNITEPGKTDKFRSVLFLNTVQSIFSAISALIYLIITKRKPGISWRNILGLPPIKGKVGKRGELGNNNNGEKNHLNNNNGSLGLNIGPTPDRSAKALLKSYAFISLISSLASPFGFLSLSHISFPTLLLGKSCKLVPVMMMNVILYRRKFPLHKYIVVAMVTGGIWAFMAFKSGGKKGGPESSSMLGLGLLTINLVLDGVVNSTQDEVFSLYKLDGPQMMFFMNIFSTLLTFIALLFPTGLTPSILVPTPLGTTTSPFNALTSVLSFLFSHPGANFDILLFSLTGAIGQLFIFLTLSLYGSLTLVTITVTRKMVTMLLSVFLFDHQLNFGQWMGVLIVFGAIASEAELKRRETNAKTRGKIV